MPRVSRRERGDGRRKASRVSGDDVDKMDTAARVLALAQQTADSAVADAKLEAERIISEARQEADRIIADARARGQDAC
jgi:cell division septum initiation protein DivIVA